MGPFKQASIGNLPKNPSVSALLQRASFAKGQSLVHQIVTELSSLIESLQLRPGELISEKEVSEALHISKTPVREALIRLEETDFVKIVPRVGSYVTTINMDRYIDACFVRLQLELGAVRAAALSANEKQKRDLLEPLLQKQAIALRQGADAEFYNLDQALHRLFFEIAGMPGVWKIIKRSQTDVNRIRHLKNQFGLSQAEQVIEEHQRIVDAICTGDADTAASTLTAHIGSLDTEVKTLASHPELLTFIDTLNAAQPRRRERQA